MCIKKIEVLTNKKYLDLDSQFSIINTIKCGYCPECLNEKRNELVLRATSEYEDTLQKGGYLLFDTLTYDEKNVPYSKNIIKRDYGYDIPNRMNFRCFDYTDVQKFLKRLRKNYEPKSLKYFLSSEYGTKIDGTHRPHYHIMIHVKDSNISPVQLSKDIADKWNLGRTDGVPYKGELYVMTNRVFNSMENKNIATQLYVTKYLTKDSIFSKDIKQKVNKICRYITKFDKKFYDTYCGKLKLNEIKRSLNQFYKVSKNFGEKYIEKIDVKSYIDNGYVIINDYKKVKIKVPLSGYYLRKLFYDYNSENKEWILNSNGKKLKIKENLRLFDKICRKNEEKMINIKNYDISLYNEIKNTLNGRNLDDFTFYNLFVKNRYFKDKIKLNIKEYNDVQFIEKNVVRFYGTRRDRFENDGLYISMFKNGCNGSLDTVPFSLFIFKKVLSEVNNEKYQGFDKIACLFHEFDMKKDKTKEKINSIKERMELIFKEKQ